MTEITLFWRHHYIVDIWKYCPPIFLISVIHQIDGNHGISKSTNIIFALQLTVEMEQFTKNIIITNPDFFNPARNLYQDVHSEMSEYRKIEK